MQRQSSHKSAYRNEIHRPIDISMTYIFTNFISVLKGKVTASTSADNKGAFKINGSQKARAGQTAYLWVEHNCDSKNRNNCLVMTFISIPKKYVGKQYNIGMYELSKHVYYNTCDDEDL
ncbi:hypothetical protein DICVIV_06607 [Dictyocaulus viviparus]|uniref:Transthyretin-like family protein n=1 Tax=Dictyocaulus viviparus TaxID=29172 RepID=A0A0D8XY73_DICVI|nr:hypothetical protein DICVIV_06607 [Dictyocaulus viviparus]